MKTRINNLRPALRYFLLLVLLAWWSGGAFHPLHAAVVVNDNDGYFQDDYGNNLGVFSASSVRVAGGAVSLIAPNVTGHFTTVEIVPTSFDRWKDLTVTPGSLFAAGDLMVRVLDEEGVNELIALQPVNGPISLASLNSPLVPGIRVQVFFSKPPTSPVAPTVNNLEVTWNPVSQLLLGQQGPAVVQAGGNIVYRVQYAVNYVRAQKLVVYDTLPHGANSSLVYPTEINPTPYPGQSDNVTFLAATRGGVFHAGPAPLDVDGVIIPTNSVYWKLGDVDEGTTELLSFTVRTRNGTLNGTTLTNHAYGDAANAGLTQSPRVVTTIGSAPGPSLLKEGGAGIYKIGGVWQTIAGTVNSFGPNYPYHGIHARNIGNETMYNSVVYDDVTDLLNMIDEQGTPGLPADDFFAVSAGGSFVSNFTPSGGGGSFPAIVWNVGTMQPGADLYFSFSVRLLETPPEPQYVNQACLTSDQTAPMCSQITVKIGLDETPAPPPPAGSPPSFRKTGPETVRHGGSAVFALSGHNSSLVKLNELVFVDRVPTNTTFRSAWIDNPNLIASGAVIFYSTSVILPEDWSNPPPTDYTQAPADLDVSPHNHWKRYDLNPPVNPSDVTWVAFYLPQLDSAHLPTQGTPALANPPTPITGAAGYYEVTVFSPANPCSDDVVFNRGLFEVNEMTALNGVTNLIEGGPLRSANDWTVQVVGTRPQLSVNSAISPGEVVLPGHSTYSLSVINGGPDYFHPLDALANVEAVVQLSQILINGVLQYPSVQGFSPAGSYDQLHGRFVFALGLMAPGTSRSIQVQLDLPAGILDETEYTVGATVTGQGARCGPVSASTGARGKVQSSPKLRVFKRDVVDLITSGAEYDYELEYINLGTAPSTKTWVVDRVPKKTVFVQATGNPTITAVWFSCVDNLPPQALTPFTPIDGSTIAAFFSPGDFHDNGTPLDQTDDYWTSSCGLAGEQTYWIAWEVDEPALNPPQLALNTPRTVGFTARNDHDAQGAGTAGSPEGSLLFNTVGIFSGELVQAIGNQVITTIKNQPSIIVQKSGPSVMEAGVSFDWVVSYYNNSQTPAQSVIITDTLPPGITFLSATHAWNAVVTGAPPDDNGLVVPTSAVVNPDGSTTVTFVIAGAVAYRGNGVPLASLEGGKLTLKVKSDPATASGTQRINLACGTADTTGDSTTSCDDHQVTIFRPDLELLKYAAPATVPAGGTVTYQLVIANRGPINARGVALVDQLPADVSYVPGSLVVLTPGYTLAAPASSGQTLTWSTTNGNALTRTGLPAGEVPGASGNILIQFNVEVGATVPGCTTLNNCAHVSTLSVEEGAYANAFCAAVTVPPPELAVAKSGPLLARPGNRVSWDLSWVNQSLQAATGVYLVDTLPNSNLDANSDVTFVGVNAPGVAVYYHAGSLIAAAPFNPLDPLCCGWSAMQTTPVNRIALLVGALAGNTGPFFAQVSVDLIDPITDILPTAGSSFTNTVVIAQALPLCEDTADNTATAVVRTPALDLALTKTGSVEGTLPGLAPGQPLTYTLAFENLGTVNAHGVRITDTIPTTLVMGSPLDNFTVVALAEAGGNAVRPVDAGGLPIVGAVPVTRVISGSLVTWYLGTTAPGDALYYKKVGLPPGSKGSFQLHTTVAEAVADNTPVCNPATVFADVVAEDGGVTEEVLDNNTSQSCVTVRRADVAVRKHGVEVGSGDPAFAERGALIHYTIEYNNLGSFTAHDVVIDEIVPNGTTLVGVNPPPGSTVTYSPNEFGATSFSVRFDTLTAPANSVRSAVGSSGGDHTPPTLDSVAVDCLNNRLTLTFSERMDLGRATSLSSYRITPGVTLQGLELSADGRMVFLTTSPMLASNNYVLTVSNVTDLAGNFMSSNAFVTVRCPTAPVIVTPPSNRTVEEGHSATFTVVATGGGTLFYQWQNGSNNIPGATNVTFTLNPVSLADNGNTYSVVVANALGSASASASLTVIPDTTGPVLLSAVLDPTRTTIWLTWNELMSPGAALETGNYFVGGAFAGAQVASVDYLGSNVLLHLVQPAGFPSFGGSFVEAMFQSDLAGNVVSVSSVVAFDNLPVLQPHGTNCCASCTASEMVTNTIVVTNGDNFLVAPACGGGSNHMLSTLLPGVPEDSYVLKWNDVFQVFSDPAYFIGGEWSPDFLLVPGEAFVLHLEPGSPPHLTFIGCPSACPLPCQPPLGAFTFVGKIGSDPLTYSNFFSCAPVCGTQLNIWNAAGQTFDVFNFLNGAWSPYEPVVPNGVAALVAVFPTTNCPPLPPVSDCLPLNTNGVYEAVAAANPHLFLGWKTLFVENTIPAGEHITYSVGRLEFGIPVYDLGPLYTSVSIGLDGLDLSGINPAYTNLVIRAEPSSGNGTNSPCFKSWLMTYDSLNWPSFDFTVRVNDDSCGGPMPINNVVSISTTTPEISLANNSASYSMNTRLTELGVQLSVNKAAALTGETLTYQLGWNADGPQPATRAYLQVVLADGNGNGVADVTFTSFIAVPAVTAYYHPASTLTPPLFDPNNATANGWIPWTVPTATANHIVFALGDLAPNSAGNISFAAVIAPTAAGRTLISSVTGHTARRETDCDNTGSALTFVGRLSNVFVQQTGPGCVHPGDLITFTLRYGNNGNSNAADVVLNDLLPAGLTFDSAVPAPTSVAGQTVSWNNLGATPGTLVVNETGVITLRARLANDCALVDQILANVATIATSTAEVNLADNRAQAMLDCITADVVSLNGFVYHDRDNDGLRELGAGELGIPNVTVTLTGTDWCGVPVTPQNTLTDQDGQYSFVGLNPGTYTLTETQPGTWATVSDTRGTVDGTLRGNNTDQLDNVIGSITLNGGDNGVEYNFGENYLSLGNLVWQDDNNNGQREGGESGLDGVAVQLWSPGANTVIGGGDDQLLNSAATANGGRYHFTRLLPGNYYVVIPGLNFTSGGRLETLPVSSTPTITTDTGAIGPDNRDMGRQSGGAGTQTVSPVVNLALGLEAPAAVDGDDFNGMLTLDFGFRPASSNAVACCGVTQGFYGNTKGKFNGVTSTRIVSNLLAQGTLVVGQIGARSLSIQPGDFNLLQKRLPAGDTPATLPNSGAQTLATAVLPLDSKGKFKNVLLGQTITLSLNGRLNPALRAFRPTASFCTQGTLPGPDNLRGTADDVLLVGDRQNFQVPASVLVALTNAALGINDSTVQGLLALANRGLAGLTTGGASLSDINAAVDAMNRGFDECRVLVDCASGAILYESNDNLGGQAAPALFDGGESESSGAASLNDWIKADAGTDLNFRIRASNLEATKLAGEPDHAGNIGGKSVWWEWRATRSGTVSLRTASSGFDTLLAVYTGTTLENLILVADNDDASDLVSSEVMFLAEAGVNYQIVVDGFDGASGNIVLTLISERPQLRWPVVTTGDAVELAIDGEIGRTYSVEVSSDLNGWATVAEVTNTDGVLRFTDPGAGTGQRFYRVQLNF